jgi:hypothetical protein
MHAEPFYHVKINLKCLFQKKKTETFEASSPGLLEILPVVVDEKMFHRNTN